MVGLAELLETNGFLVIDGAMGTELFAAGLTAGDPPELWNLDHPDRIRAIHQAYVDAGSDIVLTNSFGGNRHRLKLHSLELRVHELNAAAAANARAVADSVDDGVIPAAEAEDLCIVCGVFIAKGAESDKLIYDYNYQATKDAIASAMSGSPSAEAVVEAREGAAHPFAGLDS